MVLRARIRSSHAAWCRPWNPSWLLATSFVCRRSTACVFIHQCSWGSFSAISLWIRSCMLNVSIAQAPPSFCCHRYFLYLVIIALLLPLLRGLSPVYSTEHIPKYRSIEKFMKLPFQRVVIHLKPSSDVGVMPVSFWRCVLSRKFQSARPSMFQP